MGMEPGLHDLLFTSNEMAGETGEACNFVKKIVRTLRGVKGGIEVVPGRDSLGKELADVVICAQNVALMANIDLEQALVEKFNETSAKNGLRVVMAWPEADGVQLINLERHRQKTLENWDADHDDKHASGELARAAAAYACPPDRRALCVNHEAYDRDTIVLDTLWPWEKEWWKPTPNDRIKELSKAGALIAAEIDRLQRLQGKGGAM
jgi:NTP pyrophosphatase (non-canonical NTP hydrolase)